MGFPYLVTHAIFLLIMSCLLSYLLPLRCPLPVQHHMQTRVTVDALLYAKRLLQFGMARVSGDDAPTRMNGENKSGMDTICHLNVQKWDSLVIFIVAVASKKAPL